MYTYFPISLGFAIALLFRREGRVGCMLGGNMGKVNGVVGYWV